MNVMWMALLAAVAVIALVWWMRGRGTTVVDSGRTAEDLDTLAAWEPQATRILTSHERLALGVLMRALPEYMILAQVPLARFLKVPTRHSYQEWLHRVGQLCADLVICDSASQVLAVVEVRSPADKTSERARKRQARMRRVLRAAGIPLHVWIENALPSAEEARNTIFPPKSAPVSTIAAPEARPAAASVVPASTARMREPEHGVEQPEPTPEEAVEVREPPASTWFDNLDSGPVPLRTPDKKPPR
jgi:Protein of unknown function (DUF2726)